MQKLLRFAIIVLLLVVATAVVYTQTRLYTAQKHPLPASAKAVSLLLSPAGQPKITPVPNSAAVPAVASPLGTEASPVAVRLVEAPEAPQRIAEREEDRQIQRGIEHHLARIAATSLAQNFVLLFQAIIYFLTLMILYMLMESVKKFADAAARSADAARKSAELAESLVKQSGQGARRKLPPSQYRRR